ncbi:MAG: dihydroneopterin aldolase [Pseudomonadota bacterium]
MTTQSTIELTGLKLACEIGTYGPQDVVPDAHLLDLTLSIDPALVLIESDAMDVVFDYDPLIAEIDRLARDGHYETQERLMTRIVDACCTYHAIMAAEIMLYKQPVLAGSGQLGVRLRLSPEDFAARRAAVC